MRFFVASAASLPSLLRMTIMSSKILRTPPRLPVRAGVVGQARDLTAIGTHDVNLVVAVAIGCDGDPTAVGRKARGKVIAPVGELAQPSTIDVDDEDIVISPGSGIECQFAPIGRPGMPAAHIGQIGDLANSRPVGVHHEELALTTA